jgi:hypothetical protein
MWIAEYGIKKDRIKEKEAEHECGMVIEDCRM